MSEAPVPLSDSYEGLMQRAQAALQSGDLEEANALYRRLAERLSRLSERVLARRPDLRDMHRQARMELSALLRMEGRYAEAMEVMEVLLETDPEESHFWRTDLATLRIAKGEVDAGLGELQALAEEKPDKADGWFVLGTEARLEGRFGESESALDQALALAGGGAEVAAGATLAAGAEEAAGADVITSVYYQRFLLFKAMGRVDDAVAAWQEALEHEPEVSQSVRQVYTMLADAGRYEEARGYVERDTNPMQAGFQRGVIANMTGNPEGARQAWQAVAALDPDEYEYGHDCWVEAVLRLGDEEPALIWLQGHLGQAQDSRLFVLAGIAWAMREDEEVAGALFQQAINVERWGRSRKQKLDSADWRLLDSLVKERETKDSLKKHFAVVETLWG